MAYLCMMQFVTGSNVTFICSPMLICIFCIYMYIFDEWMWRQVHNCLCIYRVEPQMEYSQQKIYICRIFPHPSTIHTYIPSPKKVPFNNTLEQNWLYNYVEKYSVQSSSSQNYSAAIFFPYRVNHHLHPYINLYPPIT